MYLNVIWYVQRVLVQEVLHQWENHHLLVEIGL